MSRLILAVLGAAILTPAADAQGLLHRVFGKQSCTGPNCDSGFWAPSQTVPANLPMPMQAPKAKPKFVQAPGSAPSEVGARFCVLVRQHIRNELAKQGVGLVERWKKSAEYTDEVIKAAVPDAEQLSGKVVGQLGDGTLLQKIIDFITSPEGQAFIQMLIKLLLGGVDPATSFLPSVDTDFAGMLFALAW